PAPIACRRGFVRVQRCLRSGFRLRGCGTVARRGPSGLRGRGERMRMSRTVEIAPPPVRQRTPEARSTRVIVKRVGPWSIFMFSLLFYFCVMLVVLLGLTILYNVLAV